MTEICETAKRLQAQDCVPSAGLQQDVPKRRLDLQLAMAVVTRLPQCEAYSECKTTTCQPSGLLRLGFSESHTQTCIALQVH
eukprot:2449224-Amphidinium_carterae.3